MNTKDAIEIIQGMISVEYVCKSPQRDCEKLALELARKALEENARLKAERDAAIADIQANCCDTCAHQNTGYEMCHRCGCDDMNFSTNDNYWQWRGMKERDT